MKAYVTFEIDTEKMTRVANEHSLVDLAYKVKWILDSNTGLRLVSFKHKASPATRYSDAEGVTKDMTKQMDQDRPF